MVLSINVALPGVKRNIWNAVDKATIPNHREVTFLSVPVPYIFRIFGV
jgi:hypothetical protein